MLLIIINVNYECGTNIPEVTFNCNYKYKCLPELVV